MASYAGKALAKYIFALNFGNVTFVTRQMLSVFFIQNAIRIRLLVIKLLLRLVAGITNNGLLLNSVVCRGRSVSVLGHISSFLRIFKD